MICLAWWQPTLVTLGVVALVWIVRDLARLRRERREG